MPVLKEYVCDYKIEESRILLMPFYSKSFHKRSDRRTIAISNRYTSAQVFQITSVGLRYVGEWRFRNKNVGRRTAPYNEYINYKICQASTNVF